MPKTLRRVLLALAAIALFIVIYDRCVLILGVGYTDVEVQFLVVDARTSAVIEGAEIVCNSEASPSFTLRTDSTGSTSHVFQSVTTTSECSGLGFTNRRTVGFPSVGYRVSAAGYETTRPVSLGRSPYLSEIQQTGDRSDRLVVYIHLQEK